MPRYIFGDDVISLSGTFPGYKHDDLRHLIGVNGGTFCRNVSSTCTHLVTTQEDVDGRSAKYMRAVANNVKLTTVDWLLDSNNDQKRHDESAYVLSPSGSARSKRALDSQSNDATDSDVKDGPPAKKQKDDSDKSSSTKNKKAAAAAAATTTTTTKQKTPEKSEPKLKIPVDNGYFAASGFQVYIDDDGVIYDAALNQTNASNNNNKFYIIQLLVQSSTKGKNFRVTQRWGRVGEYGQATTINGGSLDEVMKPFMKKFRDKTGLPWEKRLDTPKPGKYTFVERDYEDDEDEAEKTPKKGKDKSAPKVEDEDEDEEEVSALECTLSQPVRELVQLIFNQQHWLSTMASMDYDANKLPLGKLSKRTLQSGYQVLKDLSEVVNNPGIASTKHNSSFSQVVEHLSNRYLTEIPHSFGRRRPPVINNQQMIKREIDLLEALTDMEIANEIMSDTKKSEAIQIHPLDQQYNGLNMKEMTPLDRKSTEFHELENYLMKSRGHTHYLSYKKVVDIFRIERQGETDRFLNSPYANITKTDRRLLWHGSRTTNYGGILSQGLRIAPAEAPVSGYMFGKGVYFADMSSKSANYCCSHISNDLGLLMLCDVELGDPMLELDSADCHAASRAKKEGKLATWGVGNFGPAGWKDAGCVHPDLKGVMMPDTTAAFQSSDTGSQFVSLAYNEYIAYDVAQIQIKYLLLVDMKI